MHPNSNTMDKISKSIWIANTIAAAAPDGITMKQLNEKWTEITDEPKIPAKSFDNFKHYIHDMFDLQILCDRHTNRYTIEPISEDNHQSSSLKMWLLNSYRLNNILTGDITLRSRIQFEETPGGLQYIEPIMKAMQNNHMISFSYQTFYWEQPETRELAPYALKLFKQRWYIICKKENDEYHIYSLDRIKDLSISPKTFHLATSFDVRQFFNDAFGIYHNSTMHAEEVLIKVDAANAKYIKSLPWHHSQTIVEENGDFIIFRFFIENAFDFRQQILAHASCCEVLAPLSLRQQIKDELNKALSHYTNHPHH